VAADPVGLCRRCPSLPRSASYDQRPFSRVVVDGALRFAPALASATVEMVDSWDGVTECRSFAATAPWVVPK
jgi:hypothetical protein